MKPFWSNCVIVALRAKFKDWSGVELLPIWKGLHFHLMWYDKEEGTFRHFTYANPDGMSTTLWFKGTVKDVKREHLEKWCKDKGIRLKV